MGGGHARDDTEQRTLRVPRVRGRGAARAGRFLRADTAVAVGLGRRLVQNRLVRLVAVTSVIFAATIAALVWRRALAERRVTRDASAGRLHHAADAGRIAMLQELARIRATLRDVVDAPPGVRSAKLAELAGNDPERTAMVLEDQRVTLFPARVLRYVPDPSSGDSIDDPRAGALLRAAREDVMTGQPARALVAYNELARMHGVSVRRDPASLIARYERLPLLPRLSRSAEAVALVHDLESGTWTLSRSTYESYRDELDYFVPGDRDIPLWEEAVHAVRAASQTTADRGGEVVIWVDESHPVLLMWQSRGPAAVALAVTGRYVADRWLRAPPGFGYGIERVDRQAFLPYPPRDPHTERPLSFAGHEWRMITFAWP